MTGALLRRTALSAASRPPPTREPRGFAASTGSLDASATHKAAGVHQVARRRPRGRAAFTLVRLPLAGAGTDPTAQVID